MINGYINPYDILVKEKDLRFLQDQREFASNGITVNGEDVVDDIQVKLVERIMGSGLISSIYKWTGSYLINNYCERAKRYIEEEYLYITTNNVDLRQELKMSFVLFAGIGEWLDIVEFKSNELRDSARILLDTIKFLSFSKAMEKSLMDDIASGKLTKWFEFTMSSYICLLAHLWKSMPLKRNIIEAIANDANKIIKDKHTIEGLFLYEFNSFFLDYTILDYFKYHQRDIRQFGNSSLSLKIRKDLVDDILSSADTIISNVEECM